MSHPGGGTEEDPTVITNLDRDALRKSSAPATEPVSLTKPGSGTVGPASVPRADLPPQPFAETMHGPQFEQAPPFPQTPPFPQAPPFQQTQIAPQPSYPSGPFPGAGHYTPPPNTPRPGRSRTPWILAGVALVCVIALVAGVVWFVNRSSASDGGPDLLAGQLTRSFDSAPSSDWSVSVDDLGGERFISPLPWNNQYLQTGVVQDGTTILTLVGEASSTGGRDLIGIDVTNGQHWKFERSVDNCADTIVDHMIACQSRGSVVLIDTLTGERKSRTSLPMRSPYGVAFNGDAAFVRYFDDRGVHIVKMSRDGVDWDEVTSFDDGMPSGDASYFTATRGAVVSAGTGVVFAVSADDGHRLLAEPGSSRVDRLADDSLVVMTGSFTGGTAKWGPVAVVRPDGSVDDVEGTAVAVPQVATPAQRDTALVDNNLTRLSDGHRFWSRGLDATIGSVGILPLADDREVIAYDPGRSALASLDTATGNNRYSIPAAGLTGRNVVTDGEHLIVADSDGGIEAYTLAEGTSVWSLPAKALGNVAVDSDSSVPPAQVTVAGERLVTITASSIRGFSSNGPEAIVPGTSRSTESDADPGSGADRYVTPCGSAPVFTPQSFRTSAGGLGVTMKVSAQCPDGDVLYGPQTRITVKDGDGLVASGNFDFAKTPVAVPSLKDADGGLTMELTYPPGSFFRLPDTLSAQGNSGGNTFVVDCDKGPTPGPAPKLRVPTQGAAAVSAEATQASLPPGADLSATSVDALRLQADSDKAFILANLNNHWVAQLSSKRPGLRADGRVWDNQSILDEFLALRLRFDDVRLLYSDEWSVFDYKGWWVTVAAATFPGPDAANNWCRTQGFDRDHCFAKLVSTTARPDDSTRYWS